MPYLTNDSAAADTVCRTFRIPSNFLKEFMGALYELSLPYRWEQFGALTVEEQAELFRELIDSYSEGCMIGVAFVYITDTAPAGSLALDGSTYNTADYPVLAASLEPVFDNGDGTFTLPDLRGRAVIGAGGGIGLTNRSVGDLVGVESVTLTTIEMPEHEHGYTAPLFYDFVVTAPGEAGVWAGTAPADTAPAGEGGAHENMQPSIALNMAVWYR